MPFDAPKSFVQDMAIISSFVNKNDKAEPIKININKVNKYK